MEAFDVLGEKNLKSGLSDEQLHQIVAQSADKIAPENKRILVIIPDSTRTCPLPQMVRAIRAELAGSAKCVDFLIALGTHPAMSEDQIDKLLGIAPGQRTDVLGESRVFNHCWDNPDALRTLGNLDAERIAEITDGKFSMDVPVTINKLVGEYDLSIVVGPVFPHEVVGFSGGNKYFFPGVCGPEMLNFFHWLGAVITNPRIIGTKHTPVRQTIESAAAMIPTDTLAFCMVMQANRTVGMFFGEVADAWSAAADLSDQANVLYMDRSFDSILSRAPEMYDDLWTGGKCMYKLEPIVADGGELIIYAPHITEISVTHGDIIEKIGYHTRDYFLSQWDKFKDFPWGILAHSTHVRGIGTYIDGVERPRVQVTLATGIPEETCRKVNLGYRDPASIDVAQWQGCEDQGRLFIPKAGEMLYKIKNPPAWQTFQK